MSIQIDTANQIKIDGQNTGLALSQRREGTVVYTPESRTTGRHYKEHRMPFSRYSTSHDEPHKPGEVYNPEKCAGREQLEADARELLVRLLAFERGWFARFDGSSWVPCGSQEPGAVPDLNRAADHLFMVQS